MSQFQFEQEDSGTYQLLWGAFHSRLQSTWCNLIAFCRCSFSSAALRNCSNTFLEVLIAVGAAGCFISCAHDLALFRTMPCKEEEKQALGFIILQVWSGWNCNMKLGTQGFRSHLLTLSRFWANGSKNDVLSMVRLCPLVGERWTAWWPDNRSVYQGCNPNQTVFFFQGCVWKRKSTF